MEDLIITTGATGLLMILMCNVCFASIDVTLGNISRHDLEKRLLNQSVYDKGIQPSDTTTPVSVQIIVFDIVYEQRKHEEYSVYLYLQMLWEDERLNYTGLAHYKRLEFGGDDVDRIWQPDVYFLNDRNYEFHKVTANNVMIHVYMNGTIVYSARLSVALRAAIDLTYYPYDQQMCPIQMQSVTYTEDTLRLTWCYVNPISIVDVTMSEFKVSTGNTLNDSHSPYSLHGGNFSAVKTSIVFQRNGNAYFFQLYGPGIAVAFMSWLSLFLDDERVSPRLTIYSGGIIALTTQWLGIYLRLPAVSYIRSIDVWMITHILIEVLVFLLYLIALLARRENTDTERQDDSDETVYCENQLFTKLSNFSKRFNERVCCCCCSCFRRCCCSCNTGIPTGADSTDKRLAVIQAKLIDLVAIMSFCLYYCVFLAVFYSCIPGHKIAMVTLLILNPVMLCTSVAVVLFMFGCVLKCSGTHQRESYRPRVSPSPRRARLNLLENATSNIENSFSELLC